MLFVYLSMMDTDEERKRMADIYEQHKFACFRVALKISNNYAMAEDAVHNAFVSVIKHKEKYLQLSFKDFRSSIIIIVKNKCLDLLKAEKNFTDFSIDEIEYQLESDDSPIDIQIIT
ncbi:MAG: sigma-70 family RNA polymerase sigma factor [Clostridiales bacterium]|nr:sigma-70 family RNA polymerase sigma factor [Clostridiales bacterium]